MQGTYVQNRLVNYVSTSALQIVIYIFYYFPTPLAYMKVLI